MTTAADAPISGPNRIAESVVHVGLQLQNHDPNPYVYAGPDDWLRKAKDSPASLAEISRELTRLLSELDRTSFADEAEGALRKTLLTDRLTAMQTRAGILQGNFPASFDEEIEKLFFVKVPARDEAFFRGLASELEGIVPGKGPLADRVRAFNDRFLIAPDKVEPAMQAAMKEAQARTRAQIDLPEDEEATINIVDECVAMGYCEYLGGGKSNILINVSVPIHLNRIAYLATHEAYPGHHVQATLLENAVIRGRGWIEFAMLPLYGGHTILAEGAANYGVSLSFDAGERLAFDRDVIMPLAGLSDVTEQLPEYHRFADLILALDYARNEAARMYLYGGASRKDAVEWLMEYGLESRGVAELRLGFAEALRSYVVTYNYGLDWVTQEIEHGASLSRPERWNRLLRLFDTPVQPMSTTL